MIRHTTIKITTRGKGLYPFTHLVEDWFRTLNVSDGVLTLFIQHTSCSLVLQENADPDVTLAEVRHETHDLSFLRTFDQVK